MKMAKASIADLNAAHSISQAIESLESGYLPLAMCDENSEELVFYDGPKHAEKVVDHLLGIAAQGSLFRVVGGMFVLLDPRNEVIDPEADAIEIHPKFEKLAQEKEALQRQLDNIMLQFCPEKLSDEQRARCAVQNT